MLTLAEAALALVAIPLCFPTATKNVLADPTIHPAASLDRVLRSGFSHVFFLSSPSLTMAYQANLP